MIKSQQTAKAMSMLTERIDKIKIDLSTLPRRQDKEKSELRHKCEEDFKTKKLNYLKAIEEAVSKKEQQVSDLIDTLPDIDKQEYAGKYEMQTLEQHLTEIYPDTLIADYVCLQPIDFESETEGMNIFPLFCPRT